MDRPHSVSLGIFVCFSCPSFLGTGPLCLSRNKPLVKHRHTGIYFQCSILSLLLISGALKHTTSLTKEIWLLGVVSFPSITLEFSLF